MSQYAKDLPVDKNNNPYSSTTPNYVANQSWSGVPLTSSVIGLSDKTTVVQIAAVGGPVSFKWGGGSVTGTSFDGTVSGGTQGIFVVPVSIMAAVSVMGAGGANGLYNSISVKTSTATSASVFGAEF